MHARLTRSLIAVGLATAGLAQTACGRANPDAPVRATGYVEATEVRVASEVGGRVVDVSVREGDRVEVGAAVGRLSTADTELLVMRADAERDHAVAQLRLLQAGARPEDIRQAAAQVEVAESEIRAARAELEAASADLARFEALLEKSAGSRKQRDDAATRRELAAARLKGTQERARAAAETLARTKAGARAEELAAARALIAAVDAQIASLRKSLADAVVTAPVAGIVTEKLVDAGEVVAPRTPLVVVTDLDNAWANVYVDEPVVPRLRIGQPVTVVTDAGQRMAGRITFISPRAEFTPRNVQTAEERSRLVYRLKVSTDNREGILKAGMPVEVEIGPES